MLPGYEGAWTGRVVKIGKKWKTRLDWGLTAMEVNLHIG